MEPLQERLGDAVLDGDFLEPEPERVLFGNSYVRWIGWSERGLCVMGQRGSPGSRLASAEFVVKGPDSRLPTGASGPFRPDRGVRARCRQQRNRASGERLSGSRTVVVAQQTAESLPPVDLTCARSGIRKLGIDKLAIDALVAPFPMVVRQVLVDHAAHLTPRSRTGVVR